MTNTNILAGWTFNGTETILVDEQPPRSIGRTMEDIKRRIDMLRESLFKGLDSGQSETADIATTNPVMRGYRTIRRSSSKLLRSTAQRIHLGDNDTPDSVKRARLNDIVFIGGLLEDRPREFVDVKGIKRLHARAIEILNGSGSEDRQQHEQAGHLIGFASALLRRKPLLLASDNSTSATNQNTWVLAFSMYEAALEIIDSEEEAEYLDLATEGKHLEPDQETEEILDQYCEFRIRCLSSLIWIRITHAGVDNPPEDLESVKQLALGELDKTQNRLEEKIREGIDNYPGYYDRLISGAANFNDGQHSCLALLFVFSCRSTQLENHLFLEDLLEFREEFTYSLNENHILALQYFEIAISACVPNVGAAEPPLSLERAERILAVLDFGIERAADTNITGLLPKETTASDERDSEMRFFLSFLEQEEQPRPEVSVEQLTEILRYSFELTIRNNLSDPVKAIRLRDVLITHFESLELETQEMVFEIGGRLTTATPKELYERWEEYSPVPGHPNDVAFSGYGIAAWNAQKPDAPITATFPFVPRTLVESKVKEIRNRMDR